MAEQENCMPPIRASNKRAHASIASPAESEKISSIKKRVVLGELTNSPNIIATQISDFDTQKKPIRRLKRKNQEVVEPEIIVSSDDSMKNGHGSCIYDHLHLMEIEEKRRPLANYMERMQDDINANMREILVDWLVEVADEYNLVSDTLYLTVSYVDRFLSKHALKRTKLQLLGVSCLLVASKYEEISPPHVEDFCYVTDNAYTKEEVLNMERDLLKLLNFEMGNPTAKTFLRILTRAAQKDSESPDLQIEFLGSYLAELSLLDYGCVRCLPSMVAASAIFLAGFIIQPTKHPWSLQLQNCSGYAPSDLKECVLAIHELQLNSTGSSLQGVREKYKQNKFKCVATLSSPSDIPDQYFDSINE